MTYFGFLAWFLGIPMLVMALMILWLRRRGTGVPEGFRALPYAGAVLGLSLIALVYTTIWDNYLVANGVWWYDVSKVTGITFGYVPVEEYTFFVLQPIFTGMLLLFWLGALVRRVDFTPRPVVNAIAVAAIALLWLGSVLVLASGNPRGTYLGLILVWALPPVALQVGFGADILWRHRGPVLLAIAASTLYLSLADTLAIYDGIWTIDPAQSLGVLLGGILPLEEALFFLMTNVLVVQGVTLAVAGASHVRIAGLLARVPGRKPLRPYESMRGTQP
jgi:lycopene beta-cyclase